MAAIASTVVVALGSNEGDRTAHLQFGVDRLAGLLADVRVSVFEETEPWKVPAQPLYLNAVLVGTTALTPRSLFEHLMAIERERGRERPFVGAPRTLDLDLILYGDAILDSEPLRLPHPRFRERRFVLEPLAQLLPELRDPVTGETMSVLWERLRTTPTAGLPDR